MRRHHGFLTAEAIVALALVAFVLVLLATGVGRQSKASNRLSDSRMATALAEQTLTALQTGGAVPLTSEGKSVRIKRLDTPSEVKGLAWATVEARVNGRSASLSGLVRDEALPGGQSR